MEGGLTTPTSSYRNSTTDGGHVMKVRASPQCAARSYPSTLRTAHGRQTLVRYAYCSASAKTRRTPLNPGLIQSLSQVALLGLSAWAEVGGIASSLCSKAFLPQPIST
jgi:hypothetical protein